METGISKPKLATILLIIALTASSLIMIEFVSAQAMPKPSVPEFTVRVIDHSYDVQTTTTTTTDPCDGQIITTTTPGYHMVNGSIELSIKNQPFTSYYASNGYLIRLFYQIRARGDGNFWSYSPSYDSYFQASNSTYTTFTLGYSGNCFETGGGLLTEYVGKTSGWSNTQTVTIPNASYTPIPANPSPTTSTPTSTYPPSTPAIPIQNLTSTLTQPIIQTEIVLGLEWERTIIAFMGVTIVALVVLLLFYRRRAVGKTREEAD
jgi:hypothetical protein